MTDLNRRLMLAGAAATVPALAQAQTKPLLGTPRSVITEPPRDFGPGAAPVFSPDPDVLRVEPAFGNLLIGQEVIRRLYTGLHLAEGPAWSNIGMYAIFSATSRTTHALSLYLGDGRGDGGVPPALLLHQRRQQLRPSGPPAFPPRISSAAWCAGNGTASMTVLADQFDGKRAALNSPNDLGHRTRMAACCPFSPGSTIRR